MFLKQNNLDMLNGPLFGKILVFALPIMAMNVLQLLFNAADIIVVGRFAGKSALAAVGATGALINLIITFFIGLTAGTSVVVAQECGADRPDDVSRSVHTSILISIISGLFVMAAGLALAKPMLAWMGTPGDIIGLSAIYMRIYFLGVPASMIFNFGAAILRAVGDSRRPMIYLVIAGVLNVILNFIFVVFFHMSVAGVAWATIISQYLSMVLVMICLMRSEGMIRFMPREMRLDRKKLGQIVKIGLPAGLQGILFSVSNVLIQSAVNSFGTTMVAASSASSNIEGFAGTSMNAYYCAAITFTGQNMGARKYKRIDTIAGICSILIVVTWVVLGSAFILLARPLLSIYTTDTAVIELGRMRLIVMMAAFFTSGFMNVFPGLTRGMGYSVSPMLATLFGACLLRIVWLATVFTWHRDIMTLFAAYPVTWMLAGLGQVGIFLYARRKLRQRGQWPDTA